MARTSLAVRTIVAPMLEAMAPTPSSMNPTPPTVSKRIKRSYATIRNTRVLLGGRRRRKYAPPTAQIKPNEIIATPTVNLYSS